MSSVISTTNLSFFYDKISILRNVNVQVLSGEFIGIIGPNGGGKTTFLKLIMGFLQPNSGELLLFGQSPALSRRKIGYVSQFSHTDRSFPITVLQLVMLGGLTNRSTYPPHTKEKAIALLEELGLENHQHQPFGSLSGGMAQKALLARALLSDPELLLLDEPTANIDPEAKLAILKKLYSFSGKKTVLLVTHDLQTVIEQVDRILCVQNQITPYFPKEVCEHFALGLYHAPLLKPSQQGTDVFQRLLS